MIFYKSESKQAPDWMKEPMKRDYAHYYVYAEGSPHSWPLPDAQWLPLPKSDIEYVLIGEFTPIPRETFTDADGVKMVKTPCSSCVPVYPAMDKDGQTWTAPVIVNEHGPALNLSWRIDDTGAVVRSATDQQKTIIETCLSLREAIYSDEGLENLPLDMAAKAAALIMSYSYHVHPSEFLIHGLQNDYLVPRILLAACGCGTPEHELASQIHG